MPTWRAKRARDWTLPRLAAARVVYLLPHALLCFLPPQPQSEAVQCSTKLQHITNVRLLGPPFIGTPDPRNAPTTVHDRPNWRDDLTVREDKRPSSAYEYVNAEVANRCGIY
jgi:hypothetical protein